MIRDQDKRIDHQSRLRGGFTLLETVIAMAILGMIAGVMIPIFSESLGRIRNSGKTSAAVALAQFLLECVDAMRETSPSSRGPDLSAEALAKAEGAVAIQSIRLDWIASRPKGAARNDGIGLLHQASETAGNETPLQPGGKQGAFEGGFEWVLHSEPYSSPDLSAIARSATAEALAKGGRRRASPGSVALAAAPCLTVFRKEISTKRWKKRQRAQYPYAQNHFP